MESHTFGLKQASRSIACRDNNYAREQQVLQDLKRVDIFYYKWKKIKLKKNLWQGQQRSGDGDQRHLASDIGFITKPGLAAIKV